MLINAKISKYLNSDQLSLNKIKKSLKEKSEIMFAIHNNLLYYKDIKVNYLIISANIRNKVFRLASNENNHINLY